jgi:1,4-dihydroxy-2-naphthoyl-CoA hydrolase
MGMPDAKQLSDAMIGFDRLYGLEVLEYGQERARGRLKIREEVKQPAGLVHGGVLASIAETLASVSTAISVHEEGSVAVGLSNNTSFLRPFTEGYVNAEAVRLHRGRSTWVWDVRFTDDEGRLCALSRMTIAVRAAGG